MSEKREMPKYSCSKIVWALQIKSIVFDSEVAKIDDRETDGSAMITPKEEGYAPFKVDADYVKKHNPKAGGFFVVYKDGYKSFSPAKPFVEGYTKIEAVEEQVHQEYEKPTLNIGFIAKVCHTVNKAYCESIGDHSQPTFEEAPDWQIQSAIKGVQFHIDNPNSAPSASHESWLKEKEADGWKYGKVKDPEKKEHPCIVEYEKLPLSQRIKDSLFIGVVESFL